MTMIRSRATVALTSLALLLGACSGEEAPEVDAFAASPTAEATEEPASQSPEPSPATTEAAEPSPEPSPSPCPEGQQRVVPGGGCFEPAPPPAPSPEPEPEPEQTSDSEPEPAPEPEPAGPCDRDARTFTVAASNFVFEPGDLGDVCVGDTIVMQNNEGSHTLKDQATGRETSQPSPGGSVSLTVQETGEYAFFCGFHPQQMRADVNVSG